MEGDGKSWGMEKRTGRARDHIRTRDVFSLWLHIVWRTKPGVCMSGFLEFNQQKCVGAAEVKLCYRGIRGIVKPPCLSRPWRGYLRLIPSRKFLSELSVSIHEEPSSRVPGDLHHMKVTACARSEYLHK